MNDYYYSRSSLPGARLIVSLKCSVGGIVNVAVMRAGRMTMVTVIAAMTIETVTEATINATITITVVVIKDTEVTTIVSIDIRTKDTCRMNHFVEITIRGREMSSTVLTNVTKRHNW